jgi:hypothetical protein
LWECETWSLTLKEGPRWKVSGRLLTNIFGPKKEEETGGLATLRNLFLRINYWRDKPTRKAARMAETSNGY